MAVIRGTFYGFAKIKIPGGVGVGHDHHPASLGLKRWRRAESGWQGRVSYTVVGAHGSALVEAWLPAGRLEPR